jgi:tetratricopeptide (TPR) repeat protein
LNDRERLLIQYGRFQFAKQPDKADQLVTDYLSEHPRDSLVLNIRCDRIWSRLDLTSAERCYQKLIDTDPNFVQAQNRLGYIAMAQSRFKDAEDAFKTYRFIAPDQANPHDSLGELLTLVGRYDEARHELDEAVRVRPDFCASYQHMVDASLLDGRSDLARQAVTRTRQIPACAEAAAAQDCQIARWDAALANDWQNVIAPRAGCRGGSDPVLRHLALLRLNRTDDAVGIEKEVGGEIQKGADSKFASESTLLHLEGVRLLASDNPKEAVAKFRAADSKLLFWGDGQGIMKLYNMLRLAEALDRNGEHSEAAATLKRLNDINPRFAKRFTAVVDR